MTHFPEPGPWSHIRHSEKMFRRWLGPGECVTAHLSGRNLGCWRVTGNGQTSVFSQSRPLCLSSGGGPGARRRAVCWAASSTLLILLSLRPLGLCGVCIGSLGLRSRIQHPLLGGGQETGWPGPVPWRHSCSVTPRLQSSWGAHQLTLGGRSLGGPGLMTGGLWHLGGARREVIGLEAPGDSCEELGGCCRG